MDNDTQVDTGRHEATLDEQAALVSALDKLTVDLQASLATANGAWSTQQRILADRVLTRMIDSPEYTISEPVREALGGAFATGPVISAALRRGLLINRAYEGDERKILSEPDSGNGVLGRIEEVFG